MDLGRNEVVVLENTPQKRREGRLALFFREYRARTRTDAFTDLLLGLIAALLASTHALFGVYPFATALLGASRRHTVAVYIGAMIGCWFLGDTGILYLVAYSLLFVMRILFSLFAKRSFESRGLFDEHPMLRVLEVVLVGCLMAGYELALFGIYDYTVLFALGAIFMPAGLSLLFAAVAESGISLGYLIGKEEIRPTEYAREGLFSLLAATGGLLLLFSTVLSLSRHSFFGVSLGKCAVTLFTLMISRRFGGLRATAAALVMALAEGIGYVPAFGLLGLLSGLYQTVGTPCSLALAVAAGGAYAVYTGGLSGFLSIVPEMAVTALASWPLLRVIKRADEPFGRLLRERAVEQAPEAPKKDALVSAYQLIAEALSDAETETDPRSTQAALWKRVKDRVCGRCPAAGGCKEESAVLHALARVMRGEEADVPGCGGFGSIKEALCREATYALHKKRAQGGALAKEYSLHARLIEEHERRLREEKEEDAVLSSLLAERLFAEGIVTERVSVVGRRYRKISLEGVRWQDGKAGNEDTVLRICTEAVGAGLSRPSMLYDGKRISYYLESYEKYTADTVSATRPLQAIEPSGDRAEGFSDRAGRAFALLCDGMGSGKAASERANLAMRVLSALLKTGADLDTSLSMLAHLLRSSEDESSLSLDLLSLDLLKGEASFIKNGAAASYLLRGGALYRIRAKSAPMGVLPDNEGERIALDAMDGDIFIQLSDGVMQGNEEGGWLKELMRENDGKPLDVLAEKILDRAMKHTAEHQDDMTVVLTRLSETG